MTLVRDGERIIGNHIYELRETGQISEETARAWNERLQDLVSDIEDAYESSEVPADA